ncbi:MAG TPA: 3-deoxy-D-manno-octulosonic acid transferase [Burkholderiaceae bacterium]|nr:3-deoxy-D-manno-octulosonic acid transferase [Burkholderiaceae bacterium]
MNRFLYTLLIYLLSPGLIIWMALRARRAGGDWQILSGPRRGRYSGPAPLKDPVWVHAVSLGETRAALPFIRALLEAGETVLLTHMTATGRAEGERNFQDAIQSGQLVQEWLPYDFPGPTRRFMRHYRPRAGVLIEREVWPNLLASAKNNGIPMLLVSARLSDHALRQTLRLGSLMRQAYASFYAVYAQTLQDAQRLEQAGAVAARVSGNFKFDVSLPESQIQHGREFAKSLGRKIVVIASTREGEDEPFVQAIEHAVKRASTQGRDLQDELLFCLIPRHPQRFDEAAALLERSKLPFVRRSDWRAVGEGGALAARSCEGKLVLLGDTLGEMAYYYSASQIAIIGGSFAPLGGQNFIEACAVGAPVIVGPHTRNFEQAVVDAMDEGAAMRAHHPEAALKLALQLLDEPQRLSRMGEAGIHWVQKHKGAVSRVMATLDKLKRRSVH